MSDTELHQLINTSTSAEYLVGQARYASEKYVDTLTAKWNDQGRCLAIYDAAVSRLFDLGEHEIVRLVRDGHSHRIHVATTRAKLDRLIDQASCR